MNVRFIYLSVQSFNATKQLSHIEEAPCSIYSYSLQIFNAARQLSHIEAAPDKSGLVLLDYWVGLKRCLVIIHN